jgi:hypothetical protein
MSIITPLLGLFWKMTPFPQHLELAFVLVHAREQGYGWSLGHLLVLHFCFNLIQPSTFNLLICECEHGLNAFGMHLIHCPFGD